MPNDEDPSPAASDAREPMRQTLHSYRDRSVPDLFEERAHLTPSAVAVIFGNECVTCDELNRRANQVGSYLQKIGIKPEEPVGLLLERSIDAIVCILGILKAGGAYLPLDVSFPEQRLKDIVAQAKTSIVITRSAICEPLSGASSRLVCIDKLAVDIATLPETDISSHAQAESLAYIIYTSGSTGLPKGIGGIHSSITNGLAWVPRDENPVDEVWGLNLSLSFGASISRLFLALFCGIPLVMFSEKESHDANLLAQVIEEKRVTNIMLVTPLFQEMLQNLAVSEKLRNLRTILLGGAKRSGDLVKLAKTQLPQARLMDGYAVSEVGGPVVVWTLDDKEFSRGQLFPNTTIHILDEDLTEVPRGQFGEIYVGARHIARGYWDASGPTAERFICDPFTREAGHRLFRTGDVGRYRSDGAFELAGRLDEQIKIRGYRVEPAEIEAVLQSHPDVREAAIRAQVVAGDLRIIAYVVAREDGSPFFKDLRQYISDRLPDYMVPAQFVFVPDKLPRTYTGKIDRLALAHLAPPPLIATSAATTSPGTIETAIAEAWRDFFLVDSPSMNDTFMEAGGHSLLALRLNAQLREKFGVEIPVASLIDATITEIASEIRAKRPFLSANPADKDSEEFS